MIILLALDEAHTCLEEHWGGSFRKEMLSVPAELKVAANAQAPCIAMSGTLNPSEIVAVKKLLKLNRNLVIIKQNPILEHTRIVNLARPKRTVPFLGQYSSDGRLTSPGRRSIFVK